MLPCPFCGSSDVRFEFERERYAVQCVACKASGPSIRIASHEDNDKASARVGARIAWDDRRRITAHEEQGPSRDWKR